MKNNIDKKAVGRRIKQFRVSKGYNLEEFGKIVGTRKSTISYWENGVNTPRGNSLLTLLKIMNTSLNELFYGNTEKDIQELYEQIIKLPKEDAKTLLTNVVNYLKEN